MKKNTISIEILQIPEDKKKQIQAWKAEHGEIFYFKVGPDKECYLKKPSRQIVSYASASATEDPMRYNEVILEDCWLAGHEEIKTDAGLFISISQHITSIIGIVEVEMVKL